MIPDVLLQLARAAGVAVHWQDAQGLPKTLEPDVVRTVLGALDLPAGTQADAQRSLAQLEREQRTCPPLVTSTTGAAIGLPGRYAGDTAFQVQLEDGDSLAGTAQCLGDGTLRLPPVAQAGYHRLLVNEREITLAVAPKRCTSVDELSGTPGSRLWGVAAQLYSLRRGAGPAGTGTAGMGDFTALAELARATAQSGADALAISPVHAMFSADTHRYSPYAPSSRLFLNALYVDPLDVFTAGAIAQTLRRLRLGPRLLELDQQALIDWPEVGRHRLTLLRELFQGFPANASPDAQKAFRLFREQGGEALENHARFEALHAFHLADGAQGWQQWPAHLRSPASAAVQTFAASHPQEIRFHAFLQWLADRGLAAAQQAALDAGMRIGLIGDLAVGTDPGGSHAWSRQGELITGLSPGAPPDVYNPTGQSWGLTAIAPRALRQYGFHAYIELLRACLAHVGGLRIDHALGMARMWLVPQGADPKDGAYVSYPLDDMLRLSALESSRHRAVILAENLGTVPPGFNTHIQDAGMLGMSVLWFERTPGEPPGFARPSRWPAANMAITSTHDLPTVAGWWAGRDLDWRARLNLLGPVPQDQQRLQREQDRQALWHTLHPTQAAGPLPAAAPIDDVIRHVASTPCPLVILPLEDALGCVEQANLPGTLDAHPNWRRRLDVPLEDIVSKPQPAHRLGILAKARGKP